MSAITAIGITSVLVVKTIVIVRILIITKFMVSILIICTLTNFSLRHTFLLVVALRKLGLLLNP